MGWDQAGGYVRVHNFSADASANIKILASRMDAEIDDVASAFTRVWTRDGQNTPTQDLSMGGRKFVNVGAPTSVGNFMRVREFIESIPIFMQDAESSADRISVSSQYFTSVSANQAPADGTKIMVRVNSDKSSAVLYLDGHSANVEFQDGNRAANAMVSGGIYELTYSSVDTAWKLPNPSDGRTPAEIAAGVTPANHRVPSHIDCGYFLPERYAINATPGTTVMQTGVENAIAVAVQAGGGAVLLTDRYRMSGPLAGAAKVDIIGTGEGATLEFPAGHGITIAWLTGFGSVTYDNFSILGAGGGDYYAIYQAGTLNDADELYGLNIRNLLITDWNVGIKLRTVRNLEIVGNWIQDVDRGIELIGKVIVAHITRNKVVKAAGGGGSGASVGMTFDWFNYTSGSGNVPNEGVKVSQNLNYGFDTAFLCTTANVLNIIDNDVYALVYCVNFHTVQLGMSITDNYFDMSGAAVVAGIYGQGLGSVPSSKVNIARNTFNATSAPATAIGVKINDSGNQNQNFVTTEDNYFTGDWDGGDIVYNNAGSGTILNNRCTSPTPTNSINVTAVLAGVVYIDKNLCTKAIAWDAAEAASGEVVLGHNIINATTVLVGSQQVPTVASAAALTLPLGSKAHEHFIISGTTNITSIVVTGWVGRTVTLVFEDVLTFTDGSNLKLAGNLATTADDSITLVCTGSNWVEIGRSVN